MDKPRHGIPCDRPTKSKYKPRDPDYKNKGDVGGVLKDWADKWEDWIGDLAGEFQKAVKEYPEKEGDYDLAKGHWNTFGQALREAATPLIDALCQIYTPDPPARGEKRDILQDATKPPPPPFGGSKGDDDDDDGDQ